MGHYIQKVYKNVLSNKRISLFHLSKFHFQIVPRPRYEYPFCHFGGRAAGNSRISSFAPFCPPWQFSIFYSYLLRLFMSRFLRGGNRPPILCLLLVFERRPLLCLLVSTAPVNCFECNRTCTFIFFFVYFVCGFSSFSLFWWQSVVELRMTIGLGFVSNWK